MKSYLDTLRENSKFNRLFQQERLIVSVAETIGSLLIKMNLSQRELGQKLQLSKPRISKMLDGSSNMTLRTLADIATALGYNIRVEFLPADGKSWLNVAARVGKSAEAANDVAIKHWKEISRKAA